MTIIEAFRAAKATGKMPARGRRLDQGLALAWGEIYEPGIGHFMAQAWRPKIEDILADDWELVEP